MRSVARNVALSLASISFTFVICEAILQMLNFTQTLERPPDAPWKWVVYDPLVGRKNKPGWADPSFGFRINTLGFRGNEISRNKPLGTMRIACLGDSGTFGIWRETPYILRADTAYPQELAKLLHAEEVRVEVINAGVLGYTTVHGFRQLVVQVMPLKPDIITLRYGTNDHSPTTGPEMPRLSNPFSLFILQKLPDRAYALDLVGAGFHAYLQAPSSWPPAARKVPIDIYEQTLHRFVDTARGNDVRLLFLDYPLEAPERGESPGEKFDFLGAPSLRELYEIHDEYQDVLQRVADRTHTPLLRTLEDFRRSAPRAFGDYDRYHPNEAGHRLLARLLLGEFRALNWLTPGQPTAGARRND